MTGRTADYFEGTATTNVRTDGTILARTAASQDQTTNLVARTPMTLPATVSEQEMSGDRTAVLGNTTDNNTTHTTAASRDDRNNITTTATAVIRNEIRKTTHSM